MFVIARKTKGDGQEYLNLNNKNWDRYYHYGCLRKERKTLEEYIEKRKQDVLNQISGSDNTKPRWDIRDAIRTNTDLMEEYFTLQRVEIQEVVDYERKFDFTFDDNKCAHFWKRNNYTTHCCCCGLRIREGMIQVGTTDSNICVFCVRDAHQQAIEEIAHIPEDILKRLEETRGATFIANNL